MRVTVALFVVLLRPAGADSPCNPPKGTTECTNPLVCDACCESYIPASQCNDCLKGGCPVFQCNTGSGECTAVLPPSTVVHDGQMQDDCSKTCKVKPPSPPPTTPTPPPTPAPPPPPTPPPTPEKFWKCDSTTGQCALTKSGTQSKSDCYEDCECVTPHNCGQLNGTFSCGQKINDCNVCDQCCESYILPQKNCEECVHQDKPHGCGWNETQTQVPPTWATKSIAQQPSDDRD